MDDFSILSSQTKYEIEYVGLSIDINNAQKVIVELQDKLKFSQKRFAREFKRAEELTTTLATRDQSHGAKLALKAKELQDSKAARSTDLRLLPCGTCRGGEASRAGSLSEGKSGECGRSVIIRTELLQGAAVSGAVVRAAEGEDAGWS
ncbi:hypothetical protein AXG93_2190s1310 [Marchantia polymorpha subsp. ruderalis]|uniref:Uncharacterized protein n=1 Tax=Marchantia polymorpha subsp. ruderalis TaxID=1480154 RepID=A0A176WIA5_MARPO|nr:hypothetical protein AXG93_2190s1310 [Marchantia polymorpha subsp. ruderalis]